MKKIFENFTTIEYTDYNENICLECFPDNFIPYSKVIVQFNDDFDLDKIEDPYDEVANQVGSYDIDIDRKQFIYYTMSGDAFQDIVEFFSAYECCIYQFIFVEPETLSILEQLPYDIFELIELRDEVEERLKTLIPKNIDDLIELRSTIDDRIIDLQK